MMSLTALSIDAMLPALPQIGTDLTVQSANDRQMVISVLFLGLAFGQLFFGPLSDRVGRKPTVYAGYALYLIGALLSVLAFSFPMMLTGQDRLKAVAELVAEAIKLQPADGDADVDADDDDAGIPHPAHSCATIL